MTVAGIPSAAVTMLELNSRASVSPISKMQARMYLSVVVLRIP